MKNGKEETQVLLQTMEDCHPILAAAREGDAEKIRQLLSEKTVRREGDYVFPDDWKYTFNDLMAAKDQLDGRTALHVAANIGDPEMSLECVRALLENLQLLKNVPGVSANFIHRFTNFVNTVDNNSETALHVAIENKASEVVAYLLRTEADINAKNGNGVEALRLIYEKVPEAMTHFFDRAVLFPKRKDANGKWINPNFKEVSIKWGAIFGYEKMCSEEKVNPYENLKAESTNLRYALRSEKWGAQVLCHPLVRLYLELKWKKIQWFFWITFLLEMAWLTLYPAAFVFLNTETRNSSNETGGETASTEHDGDPSIQIHFILWMIMGLLSIFWAIKELYKLSLFRGSYFGFESVLRLSFISLLWAQCVLVWRGLTEVLFASSVIGIIMSTMLVILQLGKTPCWGNQVAAWKKVLYSFVPHVPVFLLWFASFGLIFWAILYQADEDGVVSMIAIMAAMGTGELNAQDHVERKEGMEEQLTIWREIIRAFAILFFVILIVTLYFNLLIGHAVSDIQILQEKAKALEFSNKLSTIYTLESILISKPGQLLVRAKCYMEQVLSSRTKYSHPIDSIFLISPLQYDSCAGRQVIQLEEITPKLRNCVSRIAYENKSKSEKFTKELKARTDQLLGRQPTISESHQLQYVSAAFTTDGKVVRVFYDPMQLNLDSQSSKL